MAFFNKESLQNNGIQGNEEFTTELSSVRRGGGEVNQGVRIFQRFSAKRNGATIPDALSIVLALIIFSVVIVFAIQPAEQLRKLRNSKRWNHVSTLLESLENYNDLAQSKTENLLNSMDLGQYYVIGKCSTGVQITCPSQKSAIQCIDLTSLLGIAAHDLIDPRSGSIDHSGYFLRRHLSSTLTVGACFPEKESDIIPFIEVTN